MITLHGNWLEPRDEDDPEDVDAAQRACEFEIDWFGDLLCSISDDPASVQAQFGDCLLQFTFGENKLVLDSSERYSINSYSAF